MMFTDKRIIEKISAVKTQMGSITNKDVEIDGG